MDIYNFKNQTIRFARKAGFTTFAILAIESGPMELKHRHNPADDNAEQTEWMLPAHEINSIYNISGSFQFDFTTTIR